MEYDARRTRRGVTCDTWEKLQKHMNGRSNNNIYSLLTRVSHARLNSYTNRARLSMFISTGFLPWTFCDSSMVRAMRVVAIFPGRKRPINRLVLAPHLNYLHEFD